MTAPATNDDIETLRTLEAQATPGPWSTDVSGVWGRHPRIYGDGFLIADVGNMQNQRGEQWDADAAFIAAARDAVPRLITLLAKRDVENARLHEMLAESHAAAARLGEKLEALYNQVFPTSEPAP